MEPKTFDRSTDPYITHYEKRIASVNPGRMIELSNEAIKDPIVRKVECFYKAGSIVEGLRRAMACRGVPYYENEVVWRWSTDMILSIRNMIDKIQDVDFTNEDRRMDGVHLIVPAAPRERVDGLPDRYFRSWDAIRVVGDEITGYSATWDNWGPSLLDNYRPDTTRHIEELIIAAQVILKNGLAEAKKVDAKISSLNFQRLRKKGQRRPAENLLPVNMVEWGKTVQSNGFKRGTNGERRSDKCWWVRGFIRQQYYPSRGCHEAKWIAPHLRGNRNAPVNTTPKVGLAAA